MMIEDVVDVDEISFLPCEMNIGIVPDTDCAVNHSTVRQPILTKSLTYISNNDKEQL